MELHRLLVVVVVMVWCLSCPTTANKYSKEANVKENSVYMERDPFRMAKLNLLWEKALKRLSEPKLKALMSELKVQDKEEMTLKKLKSDMGDKEGLKEAELRKKLRALMIKYNLGEEVKDYSNTNYKDRYLNEVTDQKILKAVFKDKKLNKLWQKAETSGFTEEELKALEEEFRHHQDKIDQYYSLINTASVQHEQDQNNLDNDLKKFDDLGSLEGPVKSLKDPTNTLREKHREIKESFDRLHKVASTGPDSKEFIEPKVAGLWKLAVRGDFTQEELESLHTELKHYEHRLLKVRHMSGQMSVLQERAGEDIEKMEKQIHSTEGQRLLHERLAKQQRKVDKLHEDLEMRILQRHLEL